MLRVDFTFDKKIIEKNGYTMSNIYETIKMEFDKKKYFMCGRRRSPFFRCWRKEKRFF